MQLLRQGSIVEAWIEDKNGHKKRRPAVIITPVPDDDGELIVVFAISGRFQNPRIPKEIFLPADLEGRLGTNTSKDCAIICNWPNIIKKSDIIKKFGQISPQQLLIAAHFLKNSGIKVDSAVKTGYMPFSDT